MLHKNIPKFFFIKILKNKKFYRHKFKILEKVMRR